VGQGRGRQLPRRIDGGESSLGRSRHLTVTTEYLLCPHSCTGIAVAWSARLSDSSCSLRSWWSLRSKLMAAASARTILVPSVPPCMADVLEPKLGIPVDSTYKMELVKISFLYGMFQSKPSTNYPWRFVLPIDRWSYFHCGMHDDMGQVATEKTRFGRSVWCAE
jgi:hypothetical protein